jgi:hypothetical protein
MQWEERLLAVFEDLEQQAEGLALGARDAEVAELARAEYAGVDLISRLSGSIGAHLRIEVTGVGRLRGRLARVGRDWLLLLTDSHEWLLRDAALAAVRGLGERAVDPRHRAATARLGLGSALRGIAEEQDVVLVHRLDGGVARGVPRRVGADFVELIDDAEAGATGPVLVAFAGVAGVRRS